MQSKEKRKINPRRRLLMRLILAIVAIAILLMLGLRALTPKGAQIVYIAPDATGYDAIWLADLNDPENPRQLTHHAGAIIAGLNMSNENSILTYSLVGRLENSYHIHWSLDLDNGEHKAIPECAECQALIYRPDGIWLTFQDYSEQTEVYIYNLETGELRLVYEIIADTNNLPISLSPNPHWVGNTGLLMFRLHDTEEENSFALYSPEDDEIIDVLFLEIPRSTPTFSDDGSIYYYYPNSNDSEESNLIVFYNLENPNTVISEIIPTTKFVHDWHDNSVLLNEITEISNENSFYQLYLYNVITKEREILINNVDRQSFGSFNADGTQLLYSVATNDLNIHQLMLFDMETREEITLPIVGRDPQWVNGGR